MNSGNYATNEGLQKITQRYNNMTILLEAQRQREYLFRRL